MDAVLHQTMATAAVAYRRFEERAREGSRGRPTRLAGWTVGDLVDHVSWGAAMQADAVRKAAGLAPRDVVRPTLADAVAAFEDVSSVSVDPVTPVTVPAGTIPMAFAAPLFVFEAALHASDLDVAFGGPGDLSTDELLACEVVAGPMLDLVAGPAPVAPVTIDLLGLSAGIRLVGADGAWTRTEVGPGAATTTVRAADPAALVLFVCGRIASDDPRLTVTGDHAHAASFNHDYFPGP